jgi:CheY-like chemotaxis protein
MTGIQLAEAAQAGWPDLPVILVSGYAELEQQQSVRLPKLAKPFGAAELGRMIEGAISRQHQSGAIVEFRRPRRR